MKIKTVPTARFALFCTALAATLFLLSDRAGAVSIRDAHELGLIRFGAPSRYSDGSTYINNLTGMALRSYERDSGQYFRSGTLTPHVLAIDRVPNYRETITTRSISGVPSIGPWSGAVPDGGITAMLLGAALGALGIARRYLRT